MESQKFSANIAGRDLTIEAGQLAAQASGALTVRYGDTVVLATVTMSPGVRDEIDYFPLMVDYEEKLYAAGKIKGSRFIKREGRPSDDSVLRGRLIDRAIRPLFPQHIKNDIQVIIQVLSYDNENDAAVVGLAAASAAIAISPIPFNGPVAAVRMGIVNDEFVINPTVEQLKESALDMVVAATNGNVIMLEAGANEIEEAKVQQAMQESLQHIEQINTLITEVQQAIGKEKLVIEPEQIDEAIKEAVRTAATPRIEEVLFGEETTKQMRKKLVYKLADEIVEHVAQQFPDQEKTIAKLYSQLVDTVVTQSILNEDKRVGGRTLTQIRPLQAQVGLLPRPHGSGVFQRGETQVLTVTTLGSPGDEQIIDGIEEEYKKRFMHHYNFPPFSVGEVKPLRGASRRDIGHGMLAEKALSPMIPDKESFPYTIRLVSEVMGSNGSSSMASVCGSTLALMDAGVPIKAPVAGIAMGLASDGEGRYKVLTDIQDLEDGEGGMDFKIAGTSKGITAIQMDTKTLGIPMNIVQKTLDQGRVARIEILEVLAGAIAEPRAELSEYAPRIEQMKIDPEKIRDVIGPGGKKINEIIDETGASIDIEQDGSIFITSENGTSMAKAKGMIELIVREPEVGETYDAKVVKLMDFGAFVELWPGTEGLVHISQISEKRVNKVEDVLKEGQPVVVKLKEIDSQGRLNLTMKGIKQPGA